MLVVLILVIVYIFVTSGVSYKYKKFDTFKLPGFIKGSGMSFSKPQEAAAVAKLPPTKDYQEFVQSVTSQDKNKDPLAIYYELAQSNYNFTKVPFTDTQQSNFQKSLVDPNNPAHKSAVSYVQSYVINKVNPRFHLTLAPFSQFYGAQLKYAAVADFSGLDAAAAKNIPTKLQGKVVAVCGKNGYYYFMVAATQPNWSRNQSAINNILNSLKVDQ